MLVLGWLRDLLQRKSTTGRGGASLTPFRMLPRCDECLMISGDPPCVDKVPDTRQVSFRTEPREGEGPLNHARVCAVFVH